MISVIIPAYNEEKVIKNCLESLVNQRTHFSFEVIVVDNGSTDKTIDIVKNFKKKLSLRIIQEKKKGRGSARKRGFNEAKGEILLSTDADTIVPENWINSLVLFFDNPRINAISGTCRIKDCSWIINTIFNFFQPISMKLYRYIFGYYWLSGFNFAIRKETYKNAGGFDDQFTELEDVEIAMRVSKLTTIKFFSKPSVICSGRRFRDGFLKGLFAYVRSYCYLFFKNDKVTEFLPDIR